MSMKTEITIQCALPCAKQMNRAAQSARFRSADCGARGEVRGARGAGRGDIVVLVFYTVRNYNALHSSTRASRPRPRPPPTAPTPATGLCRRICLCLLYNAQVKEQAGTEARRRRRPVDC
ncbi:hypothetical protein RR46_13278 [Papilio xuthus]|uniref:Uncharacterized protein n=1 Tax=Papilio xuthus TaxID=66420 RepID=A0A194PFJ5_PAPXU|nr:hypothetical protein RR46_13278 [Papilio xuthus]